jgi:hypothetical protein
VLAPPPPPRLLARGAQVPTSQGELVPHHSPPLPRSSTSTPKSLGKRVPAARAAGTLHSSATCAPAAGFSSPSCALPAPAPAVAPRVRALGLGAWADRTVRRPRSPAAEDE